MGSSDQLKEIVDRSKLGGLVLVASSFDGEGAMAKIVLPLAHQDSPERSAESAARQQLADLAAEMIERRRQTLLTDVTWEDGSVRRTALELIQPKPAILVYGAGHVGRAVGMLSAMLGYEVTVFDDRAHFACREKLADPRIRVVVAPFEEALEHVSITSGSAVVIVTRGHQYDEICLRLVIGSPAAYVGMIGSKRRVIAVFDRLARAGIDRSLLERVHAPIGLKIAARSPQEIAVSIVAEIIQTFNGG